MSVNEKKTYRIQRFGPDEFVISWAFDQCYRNSRQRFSNGSRRDTDRAGAERFAKKWGIQMPADPG